ncbi:MAG: hypothetical protein JW969_11945 [Spirochaetales bacterium]|nr:hypothetical protein [Spirochaetales bacterium]
MPSALEKHLKALRLRLLSILDQKTGEEKRILRKSIQSLEQRLFRDSTKPRKT